MWIPYLAVGLALITGGVYAIWRSHEEGKAERAQQRARELAACLELSSPDLDRPKGGEWRKRRAS